MSSASASSMESYPNLETAIESIVFNIIDSFRKRSVEGETAEVLDTAKWARRVIGEVKKFPSEIVPTDQKEKILTPYLVKSGGQDVDYKAVLEEGVVKEAEHAEALKKEKKKLESALKKTKVDGAEDKQMVEALRQEIKGLTSEGIEAREKIMEVMQERMDSQAEVIRLREEVATEKKRADCKERELNKIHEIVVKKKEEFIEEMWMKMQDGEDLEIYMEHFSDTAWEALGRGMATLATQLKMRMTEETELVHALSEGGKLTYPFAPGTPGFTGGGHACGCESLAADHKRLIEDQQSKIDLLEKHLAKAKAELAEDTDVATRELSAQLDKALEDLKTAIEARSASDKARDESLAKGRLRDIRIRMLQAKVSGTSSPFSAKTPNSTASQALEKRAGTTLADELDGAADDGEFVEGSWSEEATVLQAAFEQVTAENGKLEEQVRDLEAQVLGLRTRIGEAKKKNLTGEDTPDEDTLTVTPQSAELRRVQEEIKRLNDLVDPDLHKDELNSRDEETRCLETNIASLDEESEGIRPTTDADSKSEEELETLRKKLSSTEEELEALRGQLSWQLISSNSSIRFLESQVDELKEGNGPVAAIGSEHSDRVEELEALREKLASSDARIQLLVTKNEELKLDNENLSFTAGARSESEAEVAALKEEVLSSEALTQLLEGEIKELTEEVVRLTSLTSGRPGNEEELSSLREKLASEIEESKKLRDEVERLKEEKRSSSAVPATTHDETLRALENLISEDEVIDRYVAEISRLTGEVEHLTSERQGQKEEELAALEEKLALSSEEAPRLRAEITRLEQAHGERMAEVSRQLRDWESKFQAEAKMVCELEDLISEELGFHDELQSRLASVDALTSGARDVEAARLRRWEEARALEAAQGALMERIDAGEDEDDVLLLEWKAAGDEIEELEESFTNYGAEIVDAWDKLLDARREKRRFMDEARRRLKDEVDKLRIKKSETEHPVGPLLADPFPVDPLPVNPLVAPLLTPLPQRLWSQLVRQKLVLQNAFVPLLNILAPHLDLFHRLSQLSLLSFLYLTQWHAKAPFHVTFPRLRAKDALYFFWCAAALMTLQTYVSARRERNLWLTANSRLTAAYVHDLQHEAPYLPWLWNVDPRLMIWGQGWDPRILLAAGGVVWGAAVAPVLGVFDSVAWGVLEKVVGPGPLGL
ncbi:uncharacterized protein DNG_02647 [Cephalotrichum gorgonifer]|uniref:Uncharacterized protein n=1 Tax=Cephalotrichum gorgonifer TaxID=2041049 RepID=A0AAE8MTE4_9PEZI|nr:uncharacterized protein DNG_02647 [Cephalotrichum gorgonifer]